ncbi:MAG: DUF58 domain-containing protein [Actinomycetes bacterium]
MNTSPFITATLRPTLLQGVRSISAVVTPVGWAAAGTGLCLLLAGALLGWAELTTLAITLLVVVSASGVFALGQADLEVTLAVQPTRITAGGRAAAEVVVRNVADRRMLGARMELPVGMAAGEFAVPSLRRGGEHEEVFVLPTVRRGIISVGPATSIRSDPLGLLRRTQVWTDVVELIVHPETVALGALGPGFLRDLEGQATNERSESDVAFHTLRDYEPGDDPRYIHWFTSARTGTLMIRQFIDTRRSHLGLVVDTNPAAYESESDVETAISVAGSLGDRVLGDDQQLTCVVGVERMRSTSRVSLLDSLASVNVSRAKATFSGGTRALAKGAPGLSTAFLITGNTTSLSDLRHAALRLPAGVRVVVLRIDPSSPTAFQPLGQQLLLSLRSLDELPHLLWSVLR